MKMKAIVLPAFLGFAVCACASVPNKVPVLGNASVLAGRWQGEFTSDDGRHSGTIMFQLRAGTDTAQGDVLLVPNNWSRVHTPGDERLRDHPHPEMVAINFVRVSGNTLRGTLEPYRDPVSGCQLRTVFEGVLKGDVIQGRYFTSNLDTEDRYEGVWSVRRSAVNADARINRNDAIAEAK